jgi:UDPglucose 6-dehydrogenase
LEEGAQLAIHDPKVSEAQIAADLGDGGVGAWQRVESPLAAATGADAVLILTEWQQYAQLDWPALAAVMRHPAWLFDARAIADAAQARAAGLQVWRVGRG